MPVLAAVLKVQFVDALLVDEFDSQVAVADPGGFQRLLCRTAEARIVCLDLDQRDARRRMSDVWLDACSS